MYHFSTYHSPLGILTLASDGTNLTGLWIEGQKHFGYRHFESVYSPALPVFKNAADWLDRYFDADPIDASTLPLKPEGTPFQKRVWNLLLQIPYGTTITYGQIAAQLGSPKASQAVGAAVGRNPISIIIPCHRVIGSDGKLTGYAAGIHRKIWLLDHENVAMRTEMDSNLSGLPL